LCKVLEAVQEFFERHAVFVIDLREGRLDDYFMIGVPFARAVNPISKTNWEGTGVEPDVKVPAGEALEVAKKMAMEQIKSDQPTKK